MKLMPEIRNSVRAVIIRDGKILLLKKRLSNGYICYGLPGGGQDLGESLEQAVYRECQEEIGAKVTVGPLIHVLDHIQPRASNPSKARHMMEFLLACDVDADYQLQAGSEPDVYQIDIAWHAVDSLNELPMVPAGLNQVLSDYASSTGLSKCSSSVDSKSTNPSVPQTYISLF